MKFSPLRVRCRAPLLLAGILTFSPPNAQAQLPGESAVAPSVPGGSPASSMSGQPAPPPNRTLGNGPFAPQQTLPPRRPVRVSTPTQPAQRDVAQPAPRNGAQSAPRDVAAPNALSPISREIILEERLKKLEARYETMEQQRDKEYKALSKKYEALRRKMVDELGVSDEAEGGPDMRDTEGLGAQGAGGRANPEEEMEAAGTPGRRAGAGEGGGVSSRREAGIGAQGTDARVSPREAASTSDVKPPRRPARVFFAEGLQFASPNEEFQLSFHNLTQAEYRGFPRADQGTLHSQFFIPRQRWYFTGRATQNVEFYTVINRGYGSLDLLDAFMTINIGGYLGEAGAAASARQAGLGAQGEGGRAAPRPEPGINEAIRLRVGRMKTPYLYEYYSIAEGDLIAPERSLYAGNLAMNRQNGAMLLGNLAKNRIGYSVGIFNGPRRSFEDFNSDKDVFAYLNFRPFLLSESLPFLNYFNIGASVNGGREHNPTQPNAFRTANDQSASAAAASLSPTFLTFNSNVTELGERVQWGTHIAYYVKSLIVLAEYGGGFQGYSMNREFSTSIPFQGWMIQGTYFLTGEQLTRRVNVVRPRNLFGYHDGQFGPGAFEVHARLANINIGRDVFAAGLADPNLWTNQAYATDIGWNWYLNYYTKIYFDWQHSVFGNAVTTGVPGHFMKTANLFWLRFQLFF